MADMEVMAVMEVTGKYKQTMLFVCVCKSAINSRPIKTGLAITAAMEVTDPMVDTTGTRFFCFVCLYTNLHSVVLSYVLHSRFIQTDTL
jgi:hypothetical protein